MLGQLAHYWIDQWMCLLLLCNIVLSFLFHISKIEQIVSCTHNKNEKEFLNQINVNKCIRPLGDHVNFSSIFSCQNIFLIFLDYLCILSQNSLNVTWTIYEYLVQGLILCEIRIRALGSSCLGKSCLKVILRWY